jgi:2'-5' RNA ligase
MEHWEEWQKVYQFGTLVIWPADHVREIINNQRQEFDPKSAAICEAHITLTQPLIHPLDEHEWKEVQTTASQFLSFEIRYGPLKSFLPYPCIWYEVQPVERILEIREALHKTGFFDLSQPHTRGFIPHMTITEGLSGPAVDESLFAELQKQSHPGSFTCSQIAFIRPDEKFSFSVHEFINLG